MAASASQVRRSLRAFEQDLTLFSSTLDQELQELRRNVEARPLTGATYFRACLVELGGRLGGLAEQLQALEAVSRDAVSLEVGGGAGRDGTGGSAQLQTAGSRRHV